jgi:hypothetical protein
MNMRAFSDEIAESHNLALAARKGCLIQIAELHCNTV